MSNDFPIIKAVSCIPSYEKVFTNLELYFPPALGALVLVVSRSVVVIVVVTPTPPARWAQDLGISALEADNAKKNCCKDDIL